MVTRPVSDSGAHVGRLPLCCPLCKGPLETDPERYRCPACEREYPIVLGIPDFRVFPDPYIDYADDHAKARRLLAGADGLSFAGLSERYWAMTPDVPPALARRFVRRTLGAVERGRVSLDLVRRVAAGLGAGPRADGAFLELGCGTGGFLVAAAERYDQVIGIDIAFRWLVIARKRVAEAVEHGLLAREQADRIRIVCCCAEYLPFPDHSFDLVVGSDVVEHTAHQELLLAQSRRALRPGGLLFLATSNRLSFTPEPHVRVWGVGFLPRRWMRDYVRLVRGLPYEHIRQLSVFELARLLRRAGFARWRIVLPRLSPPELRGYSKTERWGVSVYHRLGVLPIARALLLVFGPFFNVVAVAPVSGEGASA